MEELQREMEPWALFTPTDVLLDRDGRLQEHIICRSCGYDLISMHKGQQCPECGAPVAISIGGDLLAYSQPDWTAHVGKHLRISGLLLMLFPIIMVVGIVIAVVSSRPVPSILPTIVLLPWCYCLVQATRPDPARPDLSRQEKVIRLGAATLAATIVLAYILASMNVALSGLAILAVGSIAFMTTLITHFLWLSDLILRVPSNDVCDTIRYRLWVVLALTGFIVAMVLAQGALGLLFLGFFLAVPGWMFYVLRLGYAGVVAGELILCESRLARRNWLEREMLLDKEQRFTPVSVESQGMVEARPEPIMHRPTGSEEDRNDAQKAQ